MSRGKRAQSKSVLDSTNGCDSIDGVVINDGEWKCFVVFATAKSKTAEPYTQTLISMANQAGQKRFYGLNKEKILQIAQEDIKMIGSCRGGGRRSKQNSEPSSGMDYVQVCESVVGLQDEIPAASIAKVLKYIVWKKRAQDLAEVDFNVKTKFDDSDTPHHASRKKGLASGRNSTVGKKGKSTLSACPEPIVPFPIKPPTCMFKRGQESDNKISCAHQNEPNCYVFITGVPAEVIEELAAIKLPVNVLISVDMQVNNLYDIDVSTDDAEQKHFWRVIRQAVFQSPSGSELRNMAYVDMQVDLSSLSDVEHKRIPKEKLVLNYEIFDQVIKKVYEVEDALILYYKYMERLELFEVESLFGVSYKNNFPLCVPASFDVPAILQTMINKVEKTMKHISEVDAVKTKMIEEMNYLCGMEIPQIQKVVVSSNTFNDCHFDDVVNPALNQSLSSRILTEVQRSAVLNSNGVILDYELFPFSRSDLHIYSILLSLEHAQFSNASSPYNNLSDVLPLNWLSGRDCCRRDLSSYSSLQMLSKVSLNKSIQTLQETHPYIDFFHHPLSQSTIVVASTGYDGARMHNFSVCSHSHSNIGFQKFVKYVSKLLLGETETKEINISSSQHLGDNSFSSHNDDSATEIEAFVGYNTGDSLMHLQNSHFTFFTSDGAQVHVDNQGFLESSKFIGVSVLTAEGHKLGCVMSNLFGHEMEECYTDESQVHSNMTFYASLNNGLKIATRYYDPDRGGCLQNRGKNKADLASHQQNVIANVNPPPHTEVDAEGMDGLQQKDQMFTSHNRYQHLYVTTSSELLTHVHVVSSLECECKKSQVKKILVRQEKYISGTSNQEVLYYLPNGILVHFHNKTSLIIYCADGSMYRTVLDSEYDLCCYVGSTHPSDNNSSNHSSFLEVQSRLRSTLETLEVKTEGLWIITLPNGEHYMLQQMQGDHDEENITDETDNWSSLPLQLEDIPSFVATDPFTKQVMTTRADRVILLHENNTFVAKFPNGTIFTSTEENASTRISVECPGYATVTYFANQTKCAIKYRDGFQIECDDCGNYNTDESTLNLSLLSRGQALYSPVSGGKYYFDYSGSDVILDAIDSSSHPIKVNSRGEVGTSDSIHCSQHVDSHEAFKPKIFIINPDGNGYELLESAKTQEMIKVAECEGRNAVVKDIVIPGTRCISALVVDHIGSCMNKVEDAKVTNTCLPASLSVPAQDMHLEQGWLTVSDNQGILKNSTESNALFPFKCFLTFDPVSDDVRDVLQSAACSTVRPLSHSGCKYLQELWQNTIRTTSSILIDRVSKNMSNATSQMKMSIVKKTSMSTQGDVNLKKILNAARRRFIPAYFDNISQAQKSGHDQSSGSTRNVQVVVLNPASQTVHNSTTESSDVCRNVLKMKHDTDILLNPPNTNGIHLKDNQEIQTKRDHLQSRSVFRLSPDKVNFGDVHEGSTYVCHVRLCNLGAFSRRFKIKPPPIYSGIKIHYSPGLVAAGMSTSLVVELFASSCDDEYMYENVVICFDGGQLLLPVQADITSRTNTN